MPLEPLTDEQREIRELVRDLARERIAPRAAEIDESHEFPWDIVELYREHGLFGLFFDEAYGGLGTGVGDAPSSASIRAFKASFSSRASRNNAETFQYFRPGFDLLAERERREAAGRGEQISAADLYSDVKPTLQTHTGRWNLDWRCRQSNRPGGRAIARVAPSSGCDRHVRRMGSRQT